MKIKKNPSLSSPLKGVVIISLLKVLALLPLNVGYKISRLFSWLSYTFNSSSRKVTLTNLKLCYPDLSLLAREQLTQQSLISSGYLLADTAKVWLSPPASVLPMVVSVDGKDNIDQIFSTSDKGIVFISPHLGNWELMFTYLASQYKISALYRPPKIAELEPVIIAGRKKTGGKVIQTGQMEVRTMLKNLKNAESLFILPDQQPQQGSGVFAPFFNQSAYTMTLIQGLAKRTQAKIVMSTCIRGDGGFKVTLEHLDMDTSLSQEEFAQQLNLLVQKEINKNPEQYEWSYKRFKALTAEDVDLYE